MRVGSSTQTKGCKLDSRGPRNTVFVEVLMGRPAGWMKELTGRAPMKSPGHPTHRREVERLFWREIVKGLSSDDAAVAVGASQAAGSRWFRERGGMPTFMLAPQSGRYLSFAEREEIAILNSQGVGVRAIARRLGRAPSTISRELRRNAATRGGKLEYRASVAQWKAELIARRPKTAKLAANERLRDYVQQRLSGQVRRPDGTAVPGPATAPWRGRNKPHRQDRRWASAWSPEQISARLRIDFPDDESMRISHEAIYQALYVQGRGALRRELAACLRTGRALRVPRARTRARGKSYVGEQIMISARPAEAEDRAVPGHWEGDLILGANQTAIGTLVERSTRFTMLLHLPPMLGHDGPRVKNGPPLAGRGAEAVRDAITSQIITLPEQLRRSLTWDQGSEMTQHAQLTIDSGLQVYFCDPQSPWQRGTNENTNGLLRQYFPKGTNLARHAAEDLDAVAATLNGRPRKTLGWRTPAEALDEHLRSLQQQTVASTG
jgi:IS30 family transposase